MTESICLMQILSANRFLRCTILPLSVFTYRTCIVVWAQTDQITTFTSVCAFAGAVNMPFFVCILSCNAEQHRCMHGQSLDKREVDRVN